jgi:hypothetical protein
MEIILKWTKDLQNPIFRGLYPTIDPFDSSHFYLSDGWGAFYASMKLRKISLETGDETASLKIGNSARCLYFSNDKIFAATDNRIFIFDRDTLSLKQKIEKKIMKYTDYMEYDNQNRLLLMNHRSNYLMVLDYLHQQPQKKKIGQSCGGMYRQSIDKFWIMDYYCGEIIIYDLKKNVHQIWLKDKTFTHSKIVNFEHAYLRGGYIINRQGLDIVEPTNQFRIIDLQTKECVDEFEIPFKFENFFLSADGENLFLYEKNKFSMFSLKQKTVVAHYVFDDNQTIISFIQGKENVLFTTNLAHESYKKLSCYRVVAETASTTVPYIVSNQIK